MENLIELADLIEDLKSQYERARNHSVRSEIRKQYLEAVRKYNAQAGHKIYRETI